ncbi:MAG: DUF6273 domain-containing protein [Candidatus Bruticola sp.]
MAKPKSIRVGQAIDFGRCRQGRFIAKKERRAFKVKEDRLVDKIDQRHVVDLYPLSPIRWRVLQVKPEEGLALLVVKKCLACRPFHSQLPYPGWENSEIRAWLNGEFIESAFTSEERSLIPEVLVSNDTEQDCRFGKSGGRDTRDRLFLFSYSEARSYFQDYADRRCSLTLAAKDQGGFCDSEGDCCWWLRSPGAQEDNAGFVSYGGSFSYDKNVDFIGLCVRPALWVKYSPLLYKNLL